jgi:thioredoxin-like negative regulator of GroEL
MRELPIEEPVMFGRRHAWTLLLLTGFAAASPVASAQEAAAAEIRWRADYATALKEAQEKNLPLVIDFGTPNCYWCKKLDETTFRDPKVIALMNERYIPLKVDGEKELNLVQVLRIMSYPTLVLAAPDKRILGTLEGFQDADRLHDSLQRALVSLAPADWANRDLQNAMKWATGGDFARAIPALRTLLEDDKAKPLHTKAGKLLQEIEQKAGQRLAFAKQLQEKGQLSEAIEALTETMRLFPGLESTKTAAGMLAQMAQNPEVRNQHRSKRARDLLGQAKDYYQNKEYIPCLDRCEVLLAGYGDLPESQEASRLAGEIKNNPEWLQGACDLMGERLGSLYLSLADSLLRRGEPQRAEYYLQRIIQAFPGSRQAESAQIRLTQLQTLTPRKTEAQSAGP